MNANTESLLEALTKAVVFRYQDDKTAAGITVSNCRGKYYASVVRYDGAFAKGKQVVVSATEDSLPKALQSVATKFLGTIKPEPKNPVEQLNDLINQ